MKGNRILKNVVIFFLLWMAGNMAIGCKDNKTGDSSPSVRHKDQKGSGTSQHTAETKAELVGNY
ncbi:hypothetical protein P2W68_04935 [Chryseobacterium arthrosphaerae]|uniref:hypothetical protein n=1 Tax=Chryseobacterium arthrosphaerae TaxID=651561 RepID=UPI0023E266FC|nr:hypothetical protein [Chryseobacterium arthrosphaerae]WES98960.1 hypothetical protein P2W68_04935 [Chryseobacterium arthrosphaerae]